MKKKLLGTILVGVAALSLAACSSNSKDDVKKVDKTIATSTPKKEENKQTEFKIGETASYKGYEITVNKVDYSDGDEFVKPAEGKQFVIVNITITNNTKEEQSYNPFDYKLNANGVATSASAYIPNVEMLNSGDLDVGATVTGNITGEVAKEGKLKLEYNGNIFSKKEKMSFILRD